MAESSRQAPDRSRAGRWAGAAALPILVLAYGVFAWHEAERGVLGAAEAEGRALLLSVSAGLRSSLDASRAMERLFADRLLDAVAPLDAALAASPGDEERVLAAWRDARAGRGAMLLDDAFGVVAAAEASPSGDGASDASAPFDGARVADLRRDETLRRLRDAGLREQGRATLGVGGDPFAPRPEITVAARAPASSGWIVVRADARALDGYERDTGVARLLRECADGAGVAGLAIQSEDGLVVAADRPERVGAALPPPSGEASWVDDATGRRTLDVALPVPWEGPPRGWLRVELAAAPVEAVLFRARRNVFVSTAFTLIATAGALVALARLERRRREEQARLQREMERRERFESLGRMAGAVAHEIRGPLNAIGLAAQLLAREGTPAPGDAAAVARFDENLRGLRDAVRRVDAAVAEFLALGRGARDAQRSETDVAEVVAEAVATEGGTVGLDPPPAPVRVLADRGLLARAVANLLRNARQSAPPESVRVAWRRDGPNVFLDVLDGGPGVPAAERGRVFEPFHTTRAHGTGLGLTIAREAVERHGGTIAVDDAPTGGARFRIRLSPSGEPR